MFSDAEALRRAGGRNASPRALEVAFGRSAQGADPLGIGAVVGLAGGLPGGGGGAAPVVHIAIVVVDGVEKLIGHVPAGGVDVQAVGPAVEGRGRAGVTASVPVGKPVEKRAVGPAGLEGVAAIAQSEAPQAAEGLVVEGYIGGGGVVGVAGASIGAVAIGGGGTVGGVHLHFHVRIGGIDGYDAHPIAVAVGIIGREAPDFGLRIGVGRVIGIDEDDGAHGHVLPDGVVGKTHMPGGNATAGQGAVVGPRAGDEFAIVVVYNPAAQVHCSARVANNDQLGVFFAAGAALGNFIDDEPLLGFRQMQDEEERNRQEEKACIHPVRVVKSFLWPKIRDFLGSCRLSVVGCRLVKSVVGCRLSGDNRQQTTDNRQQTTDYTTSTANSSTSRLSVEKLTPMRMIFLPVLRYLPAYPLFLSCSKASWAERFNLNSKQ